MNRKIPRDAFDHYYALGHARSFDQVADQYHVSRRAIAKLAVKEGWKRRVAELDEQARQRSNEKLLESAEQMNARHLKVLRYMQGKAIEALKAMPLESGMDAVRVYLMTLSSERLIRGEPTERTAVDMEQLIRREYERWMKPVKDPANDEQHDQAPASESERDDEQSDAAA